MSLKPNLAGPFIRGDTIINKLYFTLLYLDVFFITLYFLQIVNELTDKLLSLTFPKRGTSKDDKAKALLARRKSVQSKDDGMVHHKPPLQRAWSEICCCIIFGKPVEKLLIRYIVCTFFLQI